MGPLVVPRFGSWTAVVGRPWCVYLIVYLTTVRGASLPEWTAERRVLNYGTLCGYLTKLSVGT